MPIGMFSLLLVLLFPFQVNATAPGRYERYPKDKVLLEKGKPETLSALLRAPIEVKGTITDSLGNPLIGVTVKPKAGGGGTVTDASGHFTLTVPEDATLVISYVGYVTQEVAVNGRAQITITLNKAVSELEQLVVVGYGKMKNVDISGAQANISSESFERQPVTDINEALNGKVAGVRINQANGKPGSGFSVRIRGANSINGNNNPLYVVDGVQGAIVGDPNDIASIEVLKGAAATAIYGSQGANGVILVTTKSGSSKKLNINFRGSVGFQSVPYKLDLLNGPQFAQMVNEERAALGGNPAFSDEQIAALEKTGGTDWQDLAFQQGAPVQHYHLALSQRADNGLSYFIAGNYVNNSGYVYDATYKRYGLISNINFQASDELLFGLKFNGSRTENDGSVVNMTNAVRMDPTLPPVRDEDGNFSLQSPYASINANPYLTAMKNLARSVSNDVDVSATGVYNITDALSLHVLLGAKVRSNNNDTYAPILFDGKGNATLFNSHSLGLQNTNRLTYDKDFNTNNSLRADLIFEQQYSQYQQHQVNASDFPTDATGYFDPSIALTTTATETYYTTKLLSYVGRVHYIWRNKYIVTAAGRVDGSSKFRSGHQYGFFPSASVAWKMDQEQFMKNSSVFNQFKWRAGYGATGSQAIGALATRARLITGNAVNYPIDDAGTRQTGIAPATTFANPLLTWETTYQADIGVDIAMLDSRITFTADVYRKRTKDLLLNVPVPLFTGADHITRNLGEVENKGLEMALGLTPVDHDDFRLNLNFNISFNRNKVLSLGDQSMILTGGHNGALGGTYPLLIQPGYPLGTFRGYVFEGVYQSSQKDEAAEYGKQPGDAIYEDLNGDGAINADDVTTIGSAEPNFYYGFNGTLTYKQFDLNVVASGRQGGDVFNLVYGQLFGIAGVTLDPVTSDILNRWTPDHPSHTIPGFTTTSQTYLVSSQFVQNGSYFKLNNVSLDYNFPARMFENSFIQSLRLYASVQNLITLTAKDFVGYDPQLHASTDTDTYEGLYYNFQSYPIARTISFGIDLNF